MSTLFNESEADEAVITSLLKELKKLRSILMGKVIKDANTGELYMVEDNQVITIEEVQNLLVVAEEKVQEFKTALVEPVGPASLPQPVTDIVAEALPLVGEQAAPETLPTPEVAQVSATEVVPDPPVQPIVLS